MATDYRSGKNGDVLADGVAVAGVRNWRFNRKSNNPSFATTATSGHKTSVGGVKSGDISFDVVLDFTAGKQVYDYFDEGDEVVLNLKEDKSDATRDPWIVTVRIESVSEEVDINDGGEVVSPVTATTMGAWTKPDGSQSS